MSDGFTHSKSNHPSALKWTRENSKRLIAQKVFEINKQESVIKGAERCGVSTSYFVYALRKHGHEQLVDKYDDRPRAAQRRVQGFKFDPESTVLRHSQLASQRLENRIKALKKCKSIVKLAEQECVKVKNLVSYFFENDCQELLRKYDDR